MLPLSIALDAGPLFTTTMSTAFLIAHATGHYVMPSSANYLPTFHDRWTDRSNRLDISSGGLGRVSQGTLIMLDLTLVAVLASSILDGTDVVMLSGETAVGKYPVESVQRMGAIARTTEETLYPFERSLRPAPGVADPDVLERVTARIAATAAREVGATALVVVSEGGETAARISDERPSAPIVALTSDRAIQRRLALYWGVHPQPVPATATSAAAVAETIVLERGYARAGDTVVVVPGPGYTVTLRTLA